MKYTKNDVEAAMKITDNTLECYLKERGWVEDLRWNTWSKDDKHTLTNQEAFWAESKEEGGEV